MKRSCALNYPLNWDLLVKHKIDELVVGPLALSRRGNWQLEQLADLVQECLQRGIRAILEWDILMEEERYRQICQLLPEDLWGFTAIRVSDLGALFFLMNKYPYCQVQLLLDHGNHNGPSLKKYQQILGEKLERVIFTGHVNRQQLRAYQGIKYEVMVWGDLLFSYTPRWPLPNVKTEMTINSLESRASELVVRQNIHGAFVYGKAKLSLLSYLAEIQSECHFYDFRHTAEQFHAQIFNGKLDLELETCEYLYSRDYNDQALENLVNAQLSRTPANYLGRVVEVSKRKYIGLMLAANLNADSLLRFETPEGLSKLFRISELKNSEGVSLACGVAGELVFINHVQGISCKTAVYREE